MRNIVLDVSSGIVFTDELSRFTHLLNPESIASTWLLKPSPSENEESPNKRKGKKKKHWKENFVLGNTESPLLINRTHPLLRPPERETRCGARISAEEDRSGNSKLGDPLGEVGKWKVDTWIGWLAGWLLCEVSCVCPDVISDVSDLPCHGAAGRRSLFPHARTPTCVPPRLLPPPPSCSPP